MVNFSETHRKSRRTVQDLFNFRPFGPSRRREPLKFLHHSICYSMMIETSMMCALPFSTSSTTDPADLPSMLPHLRKRNSPVQMNSPPEPPDPPDPPDLNLHHSLPAAGDYNHSTSTSAALPNPTLPNMGHAPLRGWTRFLSSWTFLLGCAKSSLIRFTNLHSRASRYAVSVAKPVLHFQMLSFSSSTLEISLSSNSLFMEITSINFLLFGEITSIFFLL